MAGIQQADVGPRISDNIQMVYTMGDLSGLLAPVRPLYFWTRASSAALILNRSAFMLQSPPDSAVVLEWLQNVSGAGTAVLYRMLDTDPITTLTNNDPPDWASGGPPRTSIVSRSLLTEGKILGAGAPAGVIQLADTESLPDRVPPIVITPGRFFVAFGAADNTAVTLNLSFREVPVPDPSSPTQ